MEIIEQMKSIVETNQSLTEENRKFGDILDEKDEEIKNLAERYDKLENTSENQREIIDRQKTWQKNYIKSKTEQIQKLTVAPAQKDEAIKYQKETINALTKEKYQTFQKKTQKKEFDLKYFALGLGGEVGEVQNEIKKLERDDNNHLTDERKQKILLELGDVMWYLSGILNQLDSSIDDILKLNMEKLSDK